MAYSKFPTGSQWRKWDLHLHSPMSGMANGFPQLGDGPDWVKYVAEQEKLTDVPVIGVTDYFLIDGYKKMREFKEAGRLKNIDLLLPNIEFRLDQIVAGKRINFHVIFSDQVSVLDIEDHFLSNLETVRIISALNLPKKKAILQNKVVQPQTLQHQQSPPMQRPPRSCLNKRKFDGELKREKEVCAQRNASAGHRREPRRLSCHGPHNGRWLRGWIYVSRIDG